MFAGETCPALERLSHSEIIQRRRNPNPMRSFGRHDKWSS